MYITVSDFDGNSLYYSCKCLICKGLCSSLLYSFRVYLLYMSSSLKRGVCVFSCCILHVAGSTVKQFLGL